MRSLRTQSFRRRAAYLAGLVALILVGTAWTQLEWRAGGSSTDCLSTAREFGVAPTEAHPGPSAVPWREVGIPTSRDAGATRWSSEAEPACPEGIDPDWWGKVRDDIERSEYHIRWQENAGAYQSPNRAQDLRFTYQGDGFAVEPRSYEEDSPPWKLALKLSAWGREDKRRGFRAGELLARGSRATAEGRGVTVTYDNDADGMRQNFLVMERCPGSGPLRLWLDVVAEGVAMGVEDNGGCLSFTRAVSGGGRVLTYGELEVSDARGRLLEARMVGEDEPGVCDRGG